LKDGIVIFSLEREKETIEGDEDDSARAQSLYKAKNVKIELSNPAAHSLTGIDLTDQHTKAFLECEAAHQRCFELSHQDAYKQIIRNENEKLCLIITEKNQRQQDAPIVSLHELFTAQDLFTELEFVTMTVKNSGRRPHWLNADDLN
jgi:hypothetical protein